MTETSNRTKLSAVAGAIPHAAASTKPMSSREEERFLHLQLWLWGKEFAARLKSNALRMKQFLHAGR